jgi:hypothetical protein
MRSAPINTLRLATDQFFLLMAVVIDSPWQPDGGHGANTIAD